MREPHVNCGGQANEVLRLTFNVWCIIRQGKSSAGLAPPPIRSGSADSAGWTTYAQPAQPAVLLALTSQAIGRGPIPEGKKSKLREQLSGVAILYQGISTGCGEGRAVVHAACCAGSGGKGRS